MSSEDYEISSDEDEFSSIDPESECSEEPDIGSDGMCQKYRVLLAQGISEFETTYKHYIGRAMPIEFTSRLPQGIREDLIVELQEEILPALRTQFFALARSVNLKLPYDEFEFEFEPALKIVKEIDRTATRLVNAISSIREDLTLEYTEYPKFVEETKKPDVDEDASESEEEEEEEEIMEEFSYLPWIVLIGHIDQFLSILVGTFTTLPCRDRLAVFRSAHNRRGMSDNRVSKLWVESVTRIECIIRLTTNLIGKSDLMIYVDQWHAIALDVQTVYLPQSYLLNLEFDPDIEYPGDIMSYRKEQRHQAIRATVPIVRLTGLLLSKMYKRTRSDTHFMVEMTTDQLEALVRQTGLHENLEYDSCQDELSHLGNHVESFVTDGQMSPFDHDTVPRKIPGRIMLKDIERSVLGILQIFSNHLDALSPDPLFDPAAIQYARNWCKVWRDAYNLAVRHYLKTYREIYVAEFFADWFVEEDYYGQDI